jgi:hypothetical protein
MESLNNLSKYHRDIFYDINKFSLKKKIEILKETKDLSFYWWVDILDCNDSIRRRRINISFDDALSKCDEKTLYFFIHRRGYELWKEKNEIIGGWRLEVGYRTMTEPDYFLWIEAKENRIKRLINKYNLKLL